MQKQKRTHKEYKADTLHLTPLHLAVSENNLKQMSSLIKKGANVNARAKNGLTPLMINAVSLSPPWYQRLTGKPVKGLFGDSWIRSLIPFSLLSGST